MGVPSFYRWLVNKYPKIVSDAIEDDVDCSSSNPNRIEFDNLYLDMNGIIHPCFHPDHHDNVCTPTTFEQVFSNMYEYIDRLFNIVRPRKLLFMAIDGVAPRAKMNQQRARRFRNAKDIQISEEMEEKLRKQFEKEGKTLLPKEESEIDDSNVITPGTKFMHTLSLKLQNYIRKKMAENPAWKNIKVILSDGNVPGEGEHKIMSFIRAQRSTAGYDPNTRHCLYGLDADLIMLALTTHEIHFSILREEVLSPNYQIGQNSALENSLLKAETNSSKSRGWFKENPWQESKCDSVIQTDNLVSRKEAGFPVNKKQAYQFLNVWILREYLALDMEITSSPKCEYDLERIIDDFIFICFFSGNDFLPHMPTLEIHEGCVDLLMHVYKNEFQNLGGYLVDVQKVDDKKGGYIKLKRVEKFILAVGQYEEKIFEKRSNMRERMLRRILSNYEETKNYETNYGNASDIAGSSAVADVNLELKQKTILIHKDKQQVLGRTSKIVASSDEDVNDVLNNTKELKQKLKDYLREQSDLFKDGSLGTDKVKFGKAGWKERYYTEKFSAESPEDIETIRKAVVAKYCEGLQWVLLYYFSGVPSWTWFYPYHYVPPASDLKGLSQTKVKFQKGLPFKPFDQLMGVLPPRSAHALPIAFKELMIDESSNIIDFYPTEFDADMDGKRYMWQGICKLPFIEEDRLLAETRKLDIKLKDHEKFRNSESLDRLFVRFSSKPDQESLLCCSNRGTSEKFKGAIKTDSTIEGIKGTIHLMPEDFTEADDDTDGESGGTKCLFYEINQAGPNIPRLLEGVKIPEKTVDQEDIVETTLWHDHHGSRTSYCNRFQNRKPIKQDCNSESSSQNRAPAIISKGAGTGFSLGRDRSSSTAHNLESRNNFPEPSPPSYEYNQRARPVYYGRGDYYGGIGELRISGSGPPRGTPNYGPRQAGSGSNTLWQGAPSYEYNQRARPVYYGRGDYYGGIGELRISGSGPPRGTPNYGPRQAGSGSNTFWQGARGGVNNSDSTSGDWRSNKQSSSGQTWKPNQSFYDNTTGRGRGRGGWYRRPET